MAEATKRYAVVTGGNKGMGFQICKQLASNGITVVLTARDEKRGLEAVEKLKSESGVSGEVYFHQLDVTNPAASVPSLANFIKTKFGKLDYLVNNAGINGLIVDQDALMAATSQGDFAARIERGENVDLSKILKENYELAEECFKVNNAGVSGGKISDPDAFVKKIYGADIEWDKIGFQTYEMAQECVQTNFYGTQRTMEALLPLLHLSSSPTILNVSSQAALLKNIQNECSRGVLSDIESLNKEKIDEVIEELLKDLTEGSLKIKGWPNYVSAYIVSKAAVNAYTRLLATKFPNVHMNCVCPGFVKTDINNNLGTLSVDEAAETVANIALLTDGATSGLFFTKDGVIPF